MMRTSILMLILLAQGCVDHQFDNTTDKCANDPVTIVLLKKINPSECTLGDGSISVSATGGDGTYEFSFENRWTMGSIFTGLDVGNYQIVASDRSGCADTIIVGLEAPRATGLSWSTQLKTIFTLHCAKAGCHVGQGRGDWSNYEEVFANRVNIRHKVITRAMPLDAPMSDEEVRMVVCWIDSGASCN